MEATQSEISSKNLLSLTKEERVEFLNSFDQVLVDCDGVVWDNKSSIPGAGEGLQSLIRENKQVVFVSNNSVRSLEDYKEKITGLGIDFKESNLVHPALSIVQYLKKINFNGLSYVIGSPQFHKVIQSAGFVTISGPEIILSDDYNTLLKLACDGQPVKAVIFDLDINFSYLKFLRAQIYLRNPDCQLIIGANEDKMAISKKIQIPGSALFTRGLETSKPPVILGKPGEALAEILTYQFQITNSSRVLFIGDMLQADIGFGRMNGFQTVLVLSGGTSLDSLKSQLNPEQIPDYYTDSLADFVTLCENK